MELFKELSDSEKVLLVESLVEVVFKADEPIIKQGEKGDAFYVIKSGAVKVTE